VQKSVLKIDGLDIPVYYLNTIIVGSGAAGLSCADHPYNLGQTDIAIVTEKIGGGTSNNTGSDKQTYYKLDVFGRDGDSPYEMAQSLFNGGAMHGDVALVESICSAQAFYRLVQIGVPFPHNELGGYVGYKTDHDPRKRATSAGPWTSNQMVQCLLRQIQKNNIPVFDDMDVISILTDGEKTCGVLAMDKSRVEEPGFGLCLFHAENVVFAVGGPGGLYHTSVYPNVHVGAIGLALEVGAQAVNLTESQFGLSSIDFRWNVSGTYQQVIPRYISTDENGNDEREFLNEYFKSMGTLATAIFFKGYQWPFDPRKIPNYGSSLIDILVYIETVIKKRQVYLDFRDNPKGGDAIEPFIFDQLGPEAYEYLKNSDALFGTPIQRLQKMNPMAIELYRKNGIDLENEPLRVAVCAQHNNGGLAADIWWESNIKHLFPIGEVNGSHGVYRPGGSALNSGQVGALRAAQRIAHAYSKQTTDNASFAKIALLKTQEMLTTISNLLGDTDTGIAYRQTFQQRMTDSASHIREPYAVESAVKEAFEQWLQFSQQRVSHPVQLAVALQNRHLVFAHLAYLQAIADYIQIGGGSRGSYLIRAEQGQAVLQGKLDKWIFQSENPDLREKMQVLVWDARTSSFQCVWQQRRPLPKDDYWFESVWQDYQNGTVYDSV